MKVCILCQLLEERHNIFDWLVTFVQGVHKQAQSNFRGATQYNISEGYFQGVKIPPNLIIFRAAAAEKVNE